MPREPDVFGKPDEAVLREHLAGAAGDRAHLVEVDVGHRVEVDAQLVGAVEVAAAHRPRVPVDHAEVDAPGEVGRVVDDELARGAPAREAGRSRSSATSGALSGTRFWKKKSPPTPSTQRFSVVGRSRRWRTTASSQSR